MKCPVCESEVFEYHSVCPVCNYFGLHKDFANDDEASVWERYVLKFYRVLWLRKGLKPSPTVNLESKEAIAIFQNFFSDDSHKYRLYVDSIHVDRHKTYVMHETHTRLSKAYDSLSQSATLEFVVDKSVLWKGSYTGIEINTKYLRFGFMDGQKSKPQTFFSYGHEHYWVDYLVEENVVSIFLTPKREGGLKDYLCSIALSDTTQKNEFITVLEFLKCGDAPFLMPFDGSIYCIDELRNEDLTYDTYFRHGPIKPLVFYAEVSDHNEDDDEYEDYGLCKVTISVEGTKYKPVPKIEDLHSDGNTYGLRVDLARTLTEGGEHGWRCLSASEHDYDFYLDRKQKNLYAGTGLSYRKYKFEDELLMQQVFNYLVILNTY